MSELPEFPKGFTPEFLTSALSTGLLAEGERVVDVTQSVLGEGTGMMAEIAKLELTYEGGSGASPNYIVAKFSSQNPTNREVALLYNLYERETRYCTELDPLTEACTPDIYYTGLEGENFVILMQDLTDYEVGSQVVGATLVQTELAIDELAKLHASFWEGVSKFTWVPGIAHSYHADNMLNLATMGWDTMVETFGDFIPDHIRQHKEKFLQAIPALQNERFKGPITLSHGDFRMENLLYGVKPDHHPVAIIDWQGPLQARGMFDVALFLGQSTKTEVRQQSERELLKRYVEGLSSRGVPDVNVNDTWEDYRRCMLYDWVYTAVVAGTLDTTNEIGFRWMSQMVARQVAASDDLDVFSLMPQ
jgi:aminoglycoside phosphotransferase (APT) family kinase protein